MESSFEEAVSLLDQVRAAFGLGPAEAPEAPAFRAQLLEAHPLLSLMLTRLVANDSSEERADLRHNWHKALRRRGWDALPPLDRNGRPSQAPRSTAPPARRSVRTPGRQTAGSVAGTEADDLGGEVAAFLRLFGVTVEPAGLPLALWPTLPAVLAAQRTLAEELQRGPLLPPERYRIAFRAVVDPWNELVGHSALRIPD